MKFKNTSVSNDLTCLNEIDKFTVSSSIGNGALTYPVGLLSSSEANLWGPTSRNNGSSYWLGSPFEFSYEGLAAGGFVEFDYLSWEYVGVRYGIGDRPSISLAPGTTFTSGTGSTNDPLIVPTK